MLFADLGLSEPILKSLTLANYTEATPIQAQAIPTILSGQDLLGVAQTGTGKTAAFALPCLDRILALKKADGGKTVIRCLVLTPTRELALQVSTSFNKYGRGTGLRFAVAFGGVSQFKQVEALRSGVDAMIATPGRLEDLHGQRRLDLSHVQILVLDEADQMLDMGFIVPIKRIASYCPPKSSRQNLMFSATMPREIKMLASEMMRNYAEVSVAPSGTAAELVEQSVFIVDRNKKGSLLRHYLKENAAFKSLVFTRTKHGADRVARGLHKTGVEAAAIHGNRTQAQRQRALDAFKRGDIAVLVATDVAARGLHISDVSHVVNFDMPEMPETYIHRIGRTGRAGSSGIAVSFVGNDEKAKLRSVERLLRKALPVNEVPDSLVSESARDDWQEEEVDSRRGGGRDDRGGRSSGGGRSDSRGGRSDSRGGGGYSDSRGGGRSDSRDMRGGNDRFAERRPMERQSETHGTGYSNTAPRPHAPAPRLAPAAHKPAHVVKAAHAPVAHAPKVAHAPRPAHAPAAPHAARPAHVAKTSHVAHPTHPAKAHHAPKAAVAHKPHKAVHVGGGVKTAEAGKAIHRKGPGAKFGGKTFGKAAGGKPFVKAFKGGPKAANAGKGAAGGKPAHAKGQRTVAAHMRPQAATMTRGK